MLWKHRGRRNWFGPEEELWERLCGERTGIWTGRGSRKEELKHSWVQRKSGDQEAVTDLKHGPKISVSSPLEVDIYPLFLSLGSVTAWPKDYGRSDTVTVSRIKPSETAASVSGLLRHWPLELSGHALRKLKIAYAETTCWCFGWQPQLSSQLTASITCQPCERISLLIVLAPPPSSTPSWGPRHCGAQTSCPYCALSNPWLTKLWA